ncbi:DUF2950 domain-containing protein [Chitinibacter sp. SCUT-21]|uniref:DUF2950 domain-containing protein n=1 Tax=Chitinibacter sp. SCUT-21 TaxID=2970891 RepID=UPI0035A66B65
MKQKLIQMIAIAVSPLLMSSAMAAQLFKTPDAAGEALVQALESNDQLALQRIFGKKNWDLIISGDTVDDQNRYAAFAKSYREAHQWREKGKNQQVLEVGSDPNPFAIPLIRDQGGWVFAGTTGRAEMLTRRIGLNELSAIETLKTVAQAQREYYLQQPEGSSLLHYADKIVSSPERKDGLFWPSKDGEATSPMGSFFANAAQEGYSKKSEPYHGYYFKILKQQGTAAKDGAYSYVENGKMFGGFAVLAWPASYGRSGVMSFITNHDGVIYQRNLGKSTAEVANRMVSFNPEKGWDAVE